MTVLRSAPSAPSPPRAFRLGLDLDGVFADFNTSAARVTAALTGRRLAPDTNPYLPTVWDWFRALGYRKTEIDQFWRHVEADPAFWLTLSAYPGTGAFFAWLQQHIASHALDVFFLTTRPGHNAHWQCVQWVSALGIDHPQVVIAPNAQSKGLLAQALRLDAHVDDHADNLVAIRTHSRSTALAFYVQPWGVEHLDTMVKLGATPVQSLSLLRALITHWLDANNPV